MKIIWQQNSLKLSLPSLNKKRRVGQGVKTPPFHGGITGSNPVRATTETRNAIKSGIPGFLL